MDEVTPLLLRTVVVYLLLTLSMRIMGKRQLGEMELSDLVTTLLFSEIAAVPVVDQSIPLFHALSPILILISFEIIIPFAIGKSRKVKKLLEGRPSYLIYKGELRLSEIKKNRVSLDEIKNIPWPSNASVTHIECRDGKLRMIEYDKCDFMGELLTVLPKTV